MSFTSLTNVVVNSLFDSNGNASFCEIANINLQQCNFRSAWELCSSLSSTSADEVCAIHLPEKSLLQLNVSYGEFILPYDSNIRIIGNDAIIQGMAAYDRETIIDPEFLIAADLKETSSATVNYVQRCLTACGGDNLFFTSCSSATGDTYFRLFRDEEEVAANDDSCGYISELSYTVPEATTCGEYCLHIGCFSDGQCSQTVYMQQDRINQLTKHPFIIYGENPDYSHEPYEYEPDSSQPLDLHEDDQFDDYLGDRRLSSPLVSTLEIHHVTITHFGADLGGVIRATSLLNFFLNGVHINSTFSTQSGGALYFQYPAMSSGYEHRLENCTFSHTSATVGGALYYDYVDYVTLKNCTFMNSTASYGGGIYMIRSAGFQLEENKFFGCAADTGGGIFFGKDSNYGAVFHLQFRSCTSTNGGSAVYMYSSSDVVFNHLVCDKSTSSGLGDGLGGCIWLQEARFITLSGSVFSLSSAKQGGCLYLQQTLSVTLVGNQFHFCSASQNGGAVGVFNSARSTMQWNYISNSNAHHGGGISFENSMDTKVHDLLIKNCVAMDQGGGMYVKSDTHLRVTNSSIIGSKANVGGGLYVETSRAPHFTVDIIRCSALDVGGGAALEASDHPAILLSRIESNIAVRSGGGVYLKSKNINMKLAASTISNNIAPVGGGVTVYSMNQYPLFLDRNGYQNTKTFQLGPTFGSYWYWDIAEIPGCIGYLIAFDEKSTVLLQDDRLSLTTLTEDWVDFVDYQSFAIGDYLPGVDSPMLWVPGSVLWVEFEISSSHRDAQSSFKIYVFPYVNSTSEKMIFQDNIATNRGGGLAFGFGNSFPLLYNVDFINNTAQTGGGALYMNANTIGGYAFNNDFIGNSVINGPGGGILIAALTTALTVRKCSFRSNRASRGGGLYTAYQNGYGGLQKGNEILVSDCAFTNNQAASGGAFYFEFNNVLVLENLLVMNNSALAENGGAMTIQSQNSVTIRESLFQFNYAAQRGAVINSVESNILFIEWSDFLDNAADAVGGAICIQNYTAVTFSGKINIKGNQAKYAGGAIASLRCPMWQMSRSSPLSSLHLIQNEANWGSALFFLAFQNGGLGLQNITMKWNKARVSGTLYWIYDHEMRFEVPGLSSRSVVFQDNQAVFGNKTATQPVMMASPQSVYVNDFQSAIRPSIELQWRDYYNQPVISPLLTTSVSVKILKDDTHPSYCMRQSPSLEGQDMSVNHVKFGENGSAFFKSLIPSCNPGGNFSVLFTAQLGNLYLPSVPPRYYLTNTTRLLFRQCRRGEYFSEGLCVVCEKGSFSLKVDPKRQCQDCTKIEGVQSCQGDQIVLMQGYWRRQPDSTAVFACPMTFTSCRGGNETGDKLCSPGYTGPLCSICAPGYFQSELMCLPCSGESLFTPILLIYFLIAIILVGVALFLVFFRKKLLERIDERHQQLNKLLRANGDQLELSSLHGTRRISQFSSPTAIADLRKTQRGAQEGKNSQDEAEAAIDNIDPQLLPTRFESIVIWLRINWEAIVVKSKIIVATYQVVVGIADVVSVKFPSSFLAFTDAFSFFHLSIWNSIPVGCSMHISFIDKLILVTLAPLAMTSILWICFVAEFLYRTSRVKSKEETKRIYGELKDKYFNLLFYLTYLILPSVTSTIFETFLCENIDPYDEDNSSNDYYLQADRNISCSSSYYYHGVLYAVAMIFVYPIGIPAMYFYFLYTNKEEIMNRSEEADEDTPFRTVKLSSGAERVRFLYKEYEPKYWYWELVETGRRLSLTAVLSVIAHGTSEQTILSVCMALFFVKLYAFFTPYTDDSDDVLAEVGQYQILFTFFGALIVQGGLIRSSLYGLLGVILVAINIAILVVPMRFLYKEHLEAEAKKEEKLRKELEKKKEDDELTSFMRKERERYGADDDAISPYEGPRQKELLNARVQSFTEEEEAKPPESSPSSALHLPSSSSHKYQSKPQDNKMTLKPLPPSSLSRNKILPSPRVEDHYGDGKEHDGMDDYKPAPR